MARGQPSVSVSRTHSLGALPTAKSGWAAKVHLFYTGLINALVYGHKVTLFTSGGQQDTATMTEVVADPRMAVIQQRVSQPRTTRTPAELAKIIGSMKASSRLPIYVRSATDARPLVWAGTRVTKFFGRAGLWNISSKTQKPPATPWQT